MPWITPAEPATRVAALRPLSGPSPPASQPISRTESSGMNAWKAPMALEPPPTQAMTASGSRPVRARTCSLASTPMIRWKSRTMVGNGSGPHPGADAVVAGLDRGHPVAERLVDGVLEGAAAGGDRDHLGAEHPHP